MAFDASIPDSIDPIGTFDVPSDGQTVDCFDGTAVRDYWKCNFKVS